LVSAIIPARNEEASIARAVESVASQPEIGEVIVVNDQSTDRTGEILTELASRILKLRVLAADTLPSGWTGKNYALSIGAASATGKWLLFTDADTLHLPGSTRKALADAREHEAALVSYSPEQEMETFWEKALIPVVYCKLASKFSYARVNDSDLPDAAANGQFLLIRRDAYEVIGGHAAVAPQLLEDVALAEIVKNSGHRIFFAAGVGVARTRMYRNFRALWEGWTKNLYALFPESNPDGFVMAATMLAAGAVSFFVASRFGVRAVLAPSLYYGLLAAILFVLHLRYLVLLRRNHFPLQYIGYMLAGEWLFMLLHGVSWWKTKYGSVTWKGRVYPAKSESGM